jgi:hypothetical protein
MADAVIEAKKSIADCLKLSRSHVYTILEAFARDGLAGLEEQRTRPPQHPENQLNLPFLKEVLEGVSHLLHIAFWPRLCGSLCHPCCVHLARATPPRLLNQDAICPAGRRSCSWPICEATWPWSPRAAILSAAYPVARLGGHRGEDGCHRTDAV